MTYQFIVKLDKWTNPLKVTAESALDAKKKALAWFPTCDCCDEKTKVEGVWYTDCLAEVK